MVAWRRSISLFEKDKIFWSVIIFLINIGTATYCLITGIGVLVGGES
jgi:hypothetical protein